MSDDGLYAAVAWPVRQTAFDAARRALLAGDAGRATAAYAPLLPLVGELPGPAERAIVLAQAAAALTAAGRLEEARRRAEAADRLAVESGLPGPQAAALLVLATLESLDDDAEAPAVLGQRALALLRRDPPAGPAADLEFVHGRSRRLRNESAAEIAAMRRALRLATRALRAAPSAAAARRRLGCAIGLLAAYATSHATERIGRLATSLGRAARAATPPAVDVEAAVHFQLATYADYRDDPSAYVRHSLDALRLGERLGLARRVSNCLVRLVGYSVAVGWYSHAKRLAGRLRAAVRAQARDVRARTGALRCDLRAALALGDARRMRALASETESIVAGGGVQTEAHLAITQLREFAEQTGDRDRALEWARLGLRRIRDVMREPSPRHWLHWQFVGHQLATADLSLAGGDDRAARRALAALPPRDLRASHPRLRAEAERIDARLRLAAGDAAGAVRSAARAWILARRECNAPDLLRVGPTWVECLAAAGLADRARAAAEELLAVVRWIASRLEPSHRKTFLTTPAAAAAAAIRAAGLDPDSARRPGPPYRVAAAGPRAARSFRRLAAQEPAYDLLAAAASAARAPKPETPFEKSEREILDRALHDSGGNVRAAARALGVPRMTLVGKMKRLGLRG